MNESNLCTRVGCGHEVRLHTDSNPKPDTSCKRCYCPEPLTSVRAWTDWMSHWEIATKPATIQLLFREIDRFVGRPHLEAILERDPRREQMRYCLLY